MPLTHTRTFRVRHYECNRQEHLHHANYLRYMEEAAFDATAAAGYDKARYAAMGHLWLARKTEIEYFTDHFTPLKYGDRVTIKTWVESFRRVRCWRVYEFRRAGSDELLARAGTDWIYLAVDTRRPAVIPPEMVAAFWPDDPSTSAPRRDPFPAPPPPPPGVFQQQRRAEWRDIDTAQHVNNAAYLDYIADLERQALGHFGWPPARLEAAGVGFVPRQQRIEYLRPAVLDDQLELATWISDVDDAACIRHYTIARAGDGELLTRIRAQWLFVDRAAGRPTRMPPDFREDLAAHIAEASS